METSASTSVKSVATETVRSSLADIVNQVAYTKERVVVTRHGKSMVAVVPLEDLEVIRKAEDLEAAQEALDDGGEAGPLPGIEES